jgi:hypothetical protein
MLWFLCASGPTTLQLPQFATLGEERVDLKVVSRLRWK